MQKINPNNVNPELLIRFSQNWNGKLNNRFFTTIRLDSIIYKPGQYYQIWKKERNPFSNKIEDVYSFKGLLHEKKIITLDQLPAITAALDTGYSLAETKGIFRKMYPSADWSTQLLNILLIENIEWKR